MVNYYKLLGIENYADSVVVKDAYKAKIREYHPDVNDSPDAMEIAQYLNEAKGILTDAEAKTQYDQQLKMAYLIEIKKLHKKKTDLSDISRRKKERDEQEKLRSKKKWLEGNKVFPFKYRVLILSLFLLSGLQTYYSNYFMSYDGIEFIFIVSGLVVFLLSLASLTNQVFTYFYVKSVDKVFTFNYERRIAYSFVFLVFVGPFSVYGLSELRKDYHLNNLSEQMEAKIEYVKSPSLNNTENTDVIYVYSVNGTQYRKKLNTSQMHNFRMKRGWVVIKYSRVNPLISEPLLRTDQTE